MNIGCGVLNLGGWVARGGRLEGGWGVGGRLESLGRGRPRGQGTGKQK